MSTPVYKLNGIDNYSDPQISKSMEYTAYYFLDWGLLNIGAFANVTFPTGTFQSGVGSHATPAYNLRSVYDPNYGSGRVWEGFRNNWVHETGVEYSPPPINISGIYVNDVFYPTGTTGQYGYKINYPDGRVIFNNKIALGSNVKCEFSFKAVKLDFSDQEYFKDIQFNSQNQSDSNNIAGSGALLAMAKNRVQLPAIFIGTVPNVRVSPYEMGNLSRNHSQEISFQILSETDYERKQLHDIIINQFQKTILGVNYKAITQSGVSQLDKNGSINPSGVNYKQITQNQAYVGPKMFFENVRSTEIKANPPLFWAMVRTMMTIEGI